MTWIDQLVFQPTAATNEEPSVSSPSHTTTNSITVVSWNILAEAYATPRSHPHLPDNYAYSTFHTHLRRRLILDTLRRLLFCKDNVPTVDVLCLQEVDSKLLKTLLLPFFRQYGYSHVYAPREAPRESKAKAAPDGCATFYSNRKWKCIGSKIVRFDDLADPHRPPLYLHPQSTSNSRPTRSIHSGMISSYKRRNTALLVHLVSMTSADIDHKNPSSVIVANAHLYWHPGYEYVKLSQAYYLLHSLQQFTREQQQQKLIHVDLSSPPVILICGDFNSKPDSIVYQFITKGCVDATVVAPWNPTNPVNEYYDEEEEEEETEEEERVETDEHSNSIILKEDSNISDIKDGGGLNEIEGPIHNQKEEIILPDSISTWMEKRTESSISDGVDLSALHIHEAPLSNKGEAYAGPRYMLDFTLNKLTRWLRILGIDAALETEGEERARTKDGNMYVLVTHPISRILSEDSFTSPSFYFLPIGIFSRDAVESEEI